MIFLAGLFMFLIWFFVCVCVCVVVFFGWVGLGIYNPWVEIFYNGIDIQSYLYLYIYIPRDLYTHQYPKEPYIPSPRTLVHI